MGQFVSAREGGHTQTVLDRLFTKFEIHPILVDVGATECSLKIWDSIARHSIYVGAGPEVRLSCSRERTAFYQTHLLNEIVTASEVRNQIPFYVTNDPLYSSLLKPKKAANTTGFLDWVSLPGTGNRRIEYDD